MSASHHLRIQVCRASVLAEAPLAANAGAGVPGRRGDDVDERRDDA
ncbi:MAG: hypothetical protein ACJ79S_05905 [Gemmatimonadaceae bacterium]